MMKAAREGRLDVGSGSHTPKRAMNLAEELTLLHRPNGISKADRETRKSDGLPKRDFTSPEPLKKCVTDITEIKAKDG